MFLFFHFVFSVRQGVCILKVCQYSEIVVVCLLIKSELPLTGVVLGEAGLEAEAGVTILHLGPGPLGITKQVFPLEAFAIVLYQFEVGLFSESLRAVRAGIIPIKVRNVTELGFFQTEKREF